MLSTAQDEFWEDLLAYLEEGRVVPIVGPELATVSRPTGIATVHRVIAEKLAERLRLDACALPPEFGINDVVCASLAAGGRREELYSKVRAIAKDLGVAPPDALRRLARIPAFDLFVSTTFDSLLVDALNQERFGGEQRALHLAYSPNKAQDLPAPRGRLPAPVVYSLFGKVSVAPDYVISDEDTLEFMCALQSEARRPHLLFDELQNNHLLIVGCPFPDWLARFFIRLSKSRQLSVQRGESEIVVDRRADIDRNLVLFLKSFSYATKITAVDAAEFVTELERRWFERYPGYTGPERAAAAHAAVPSGHAEDRGAVADMAPGAIFVSYAREDSGAVHHLHAALEDLGIDVWFDRDRLEAGDLYDQKIKRNIRNCSLFMPVISRATERRLEGYFRREWRLAEERSMGIADQVPFILPVVIDDTPEYSGAVPETFHKAQWARLPEGRMTPEFEARVVQLVRDARKRERGLA